MGGSADSPRERIQSEAAQRGTPAFATACAHLLLGQAPDITLMNVLAGRAASWFAGQDDPRNDYWPRVWAARGLLWAWDDVALPALLSALTDDAWRVREMAFKVVARHRLDDALDQALTARTADTTARVRTAASTAVMRLTG